MPSLSERLDDIPLLIQYFLKKYNRAYSKQIQGLTRRAQAVLLQHAWPGNVRELENVISCACLTSVNEFIDVDDLPENLQKPAGRDVNSKEIWRPLPLEEIRRQHIRRVLDACEGNRVRAAQLAGHWPHEPLPVPETIREKARPLPHFHFSGVAVRFPPPAFRLVGLLGREGSPSTRHRQKPQGKSGVFFSSPAVCCLGRALRGGGGRHRKELARGHPRRAACGAHKGKGRKKASFLFDLAGEMKRIDPGHLFSDRGFVKDVTDVGCRFDTRTQLQCGDIVAVKPLEPGEKVMTDQHSQLFEVMWAANHGTRCTVGARKLYGDKLADFKFPPPNYSPRHPVK